MGSIVKRVGIDGNVSWQAKVRLQGRSQSATFHKKTLAQEWMKTTEAKILQGQSVEIHKVRRTSLADVFADYIKEAAPRDKKVGTLRRLAVEIGDIKLEELTTKRLGLYLEIKKEQAVPASARKKVDHPLYQAGREVVNGKVVQRTYKPSSIRHYYYALRTALQWHAKVNDYHFNEKPFTDNPPPAAWNSPRDRRLEDDELERLLRACDKMYKNRQHLKDFIEFQIFSCMRAGETLLMRWSDIHFDEKDPEASFIFVPKENQKTKNKRGSDDREVPMRPELYHLVKDRLMTRAAEHDERVFPFWVDSNVLGHRFKVVCKNANVDDFKIHDFRHEGISWLFENTSLTDIEISKITGHLELDTLKRYAKLRPKKIGAKLWATQNQSRSV